MEDVEEKENKDRRRREKEREATATTGPLSSTFEFLRKNHERWALVWKSYKTGLFY